MNATQKKAVTKAVNDYFNNGVSLDDTAQILSQNGVSFSDIKPTEKVLTGRSR